MYVKWCVHEGKGLKCDKRIEKVCKRESLQMNMGNVTEKMSQFDFFVLKCSI